MAESGLRAHKRARIRLGILDASLAELAGGGSEDWNVERVCARVEISKVTFFKYFPHKEEVLVYFMQIWCLRRAVELKRNRRRGRAAIEHLFARAAAPEGGEGKGVWLALLGFIARLSAPPVWRVPEPAERRILFPGRFDFDLDALPVPPLPEMLSRHLEEARRDGELRVRRPGELLHLLNTIFYGAPLTAHMRGVELGGLYRQHLSALFAAYAPE